MGDADPSRRDSPKAHRGLSGLSLSGLMFCLDMATYMILLLILDAAAVCDLSGKRSFVVKET